MSQDGDPEDPPRKPPEEIPPEQAEEEFFAGDFTPRPIPEMRPEDRSLFGEPEIAFPGEIGAPPAHSVRNAQANLDLDLGRIKRQKRYGLISTMFSALFVAFVLAPVTWVGVYLVFDAPGTVLMLQRAAEGETIRHQPVPITRMSPHIVRAVIAAEDANFCTHDGFDLEAIQDAMDSNARGGRTRGASTISQQTAKNLFLWSSRSWLRKGLETYFTSLIEFMWPKQRIMEHYLNVAEWGDGIFGIEAAAQARFGVAAADLTPLQAARLAAVLPSPNRWRADAPGPYVRRRAATIVERARVVRNERMAGCVLALDRAE
jgi:monofunctional glycosyltransferase